jgi:hypothetical protein
MILSIWVQIEVVPLKIHGCDLWKRSMAVWSWLKCHEYTMKNCVSYYLFKLLFMVIHDCLIMIECHGSWNGLSISTQMESPMHSHRSVVEFSCRESITYSSPLLLCKGINILIHQIEMPEPYEPQNAHKSQWDEAAMQFFVPADYLGMGYLKSVTRERK